jgi:chemotaxis methyl-accepting protein methylase
MARKTASEPEATKSARTKSKFTAAEPGECDDVSKGGHVKIPTVGICASAGGLEAFKGFFAAMPPDSGVAFVLIPHLDPHHESLMAELVGRYTKMPVVEAADQMPIRPNHVYVLPPNAYMTLVDGKLRVTGPVERGGLQTSIDLFLRSLATDQQEKAIGIILSGTGSHGSLGLKAIKECDGMTMVQDPKTAQYPRMPESAIATGMADFVLPVEKMPAALVAYVRSAHVKHPPAELAIAEPPETLDQIMALLRSQARFDFRPYRKKMVQRRIARRMGLRQLSKLSDYLEYLTRHPEEVKLLYHDLLIGVTSFFRDPEIFQTFETDALAPLVRSKKPDEPLRVWSAGCATGEEAYSVAMAIFEQMAAEKSSCQPQIFATDVDETAIEIARQGKYPESIRADVSAERLGRFFTLTDDTYQVNKKLREVVSFARQNLIADAPFSKLDVIVCRNLLIYLEPEIQQKVIRLFHFSLKQGGIPFFGFVRDDRARDGPVRAGFEEMPDLPTQGPGSARARRDADRRHQSLHDHTETHGAPRLHAGRQFRRFDAPIVAGAIRPRFPSHQREIGSLAPIRRDGSVPDDAGGEADARSDVARSPRPARQSPVRDSQGGQRRRRRHPCQRSRGIQRRATPAARHDSPRAGAAVRRFVSHHVSGLRRKALAGSNGEPG